LWIEGALCLLQLLSSLRESRGARQLQGVWLRLETKLGKHEASLVKRDCSVCRLSSGQAVA